MKDDVQISDRIEDAMLVSSPNLSALWRSLVDPISVLYQPTSS